MIRVRFRAPNLSAPASFFFESREIVELGFDRRFTGAEALGEAGRHEGEAAADPGRIGDMRSRATRLSPLPKGMTGTDARPPAGGLGYRGFLVNTKGQELSLPAQFLIFHGVLVEQPGPQAAYWRDSGGVEEFLLAEARQRGFDRMLAALGVRAKSPQ